MSNPSQVAVITGVRPWKRWQVEPFLAPRYARRHYCFNVDRALDLQGRSGGDLVIWASREPDDYAQRAAEQGAPVVRIEDGFLRSVGLGSQHIGGASLAIDDGGIYYDPRQPSRLEQILQAGEIAPELLTRARALRERIVRAGLTKYNVGASKTLGGQGRTRVLVPGQVEDDASIRRGAGAIRTNLDLLRAVRAALPQAYLIYKPHPDAEAKARPGGLGEAALRECADEVVRGASSHALLAQVDAVHTMTSLLGFEALLRGVAVTTYGMPFYAGWGLTEDREPLARRTRRRSLDELTAAALILYPSYVHPLSRMPCEAEDVVAALSQALPAPRPNLVRRGLALIAGWLRSREPAQGSASD